MYLFVTENVETLLKSFNKKLKRDHIISEMIGTIITDEGIYIRHHNGLYSVVVMTISQACIMPASSLPVTIILALKLHYVFNISYKTSCRSLYGVIETLLGMKTTVKLGSFANAYARQLLDSQ
jgi:predicted nucleic-acid-binding protein